MGVRWDKPQCHAINLSSVLIQFPATRFRVTCPSQSPLYSLTRNKLTYHSKFCRCTAWRSAHPIKVLFLLVLVQLGLPRSVYCCGRSARTCAARVPLFGVRAVNDRSTGSARPRAAREPLVRVRAVDIPLDVSLVHIIPLPVHVPSTHCSSSEQVPSSMYRASMNVFQ